MTPTKSKTAALEPVGIVEIAERLGVMRNTVDQWLFRTHAGELPVPFPDPRWTVGGRPAWDWSDVAAWAWETGRLEGAKP